MSHCECSYYESCYVATNYIVWGRRGGGSPLTGRRVPSPWPPPRTATDWARVGTSKEIWSKDKRLLLIIMLTTFSASLTISHGFRSRNSLSVCRLACIRWQYSNDVRLLSAAAVIVIDIISVHCIRSIKLDYSCSWAVIKHIEFPPPIWWSMTRASISTNHLLWPPASI